MFIYLEAFLFGQGAGWDLQVVEFPPVVKVIRLRQLETVLSVFFIEQRVIGEQVYRFICKKLLGNCFSRG